MPFIKTKDGTEIFYKDWGKGQPIVFSHGWPLSADDWDAQMLLFLSHGYRVIAHDRRGHGRSAAPPGRWTYLDLARDLRAVADLYGATRALGVSLGAGALCRLLADNPTRFDRAVFFLPAVLDQPRPQAAHRRLMAAYARTGRRGHALRQFLACRRALVAELGVEPGVETVELQRRVLAGDPV